MNFSRIKLFFSDMKPILLSHHPNCDVFSNHVYTLGRIKLCIGCFTFYPTVGVTILFIITFIKLTLTNLFIMFFLSFAFFIPIVLNIFGLTKYKFLKILTKTSIGIGAGLLIISTLFLPIFLFIKISILFEIHFITGAIAYIRVKHIKKRCLQCEFEGNWDECPAMKPITDKLYEHSFKKKK
ncbi:MAG: hypothetical protein ACFE94_19365 [Candidatus Hodarchaeota archaeon]